MLLSKGKWQGRHFLAESTQHIWETHLSVFPEELGAIHLVAGDMDGGQSRSWRI